MRIHKRFLINVSAALFVGAVFVAAWQAWPGSAMTYGLFTAAFTALLVVGVAWRPGVGYLLLAVVLWIGFWMKLSLHLIDKKSTWMEPTGRFDFSPAAWDEVALVSTVGGLAVLCIGLLWRRRVDMLGGGRADWYTPRVRALAWAIVIAITKLTIAYNEAKAYTLLYCPL